MSITAQLGTAGTWLIAPDFTFPDLDREGKATLQGTQAISSPSSQSIVKSSAIPDLLLKPIAGVKSPSSLPQDAEEAKYANELEREEVCQWR